MMETIDLLIDLVENTKPKCIVRIKRDMYYCDMAGDIDAYGCELTLRWHNQDYELSVTAPYCLISPAYKGGYDIETFIVDSTSDDWKYQFSIDTLSADDAETLTALMEAKMCWYAFHRGDYTIERI